MTKKIIRIPKNRVPQVIFVTGPTGSGKSTLARPLAKELGYRFLSLDAIRERFKGDTKRAWLEIWKRISRGQRVVIDAAGASKIFRLVLRASYFGRLRPIVIKLVARESVLNSRRRNVSMQQMSAIILGPGRVVSQKYLLEAAQYLPADYEIDTSSSKADEVLKATLHYIQKRTA